MIPILPQYPHYLYKQVTTEAERLPNGSYAEAEAKFEFLGMCRQEPNKGASTVLDNDGRTFICTSMIYAPVGTSGADAGTRILVRDSRDDDDVFARGVLICGDSKRTDVGRLHTRIWM